MKNAVLDIIKRDLRSLSNEIDLIGNDKDLWITLPGVTNSIGNLSTHICGNLRHFIGHAIGGSNYERKRDLEFSEKGLTSKELKDLISITIVEVEAAMKTMEDEYGPKPYPLEIAGSSTSYEGALIILCSHLSYHLGQVNYLRRIIQNSGSNE